MSGLWTIPNAISIARILGAPVFAVLLLAGEQRYSAAWLLGALGATDWLDGWLARKSSSVSDIGKVLDPVADRVLIVVASIAVLIDGSFPLWLAVVVLVREVFVSAGVLALAALKAPRIDVLWVGKAGTFALMLAVPMFLVAEAAVSWSDIARVIAWGSAAAAVVLGWWAAASYVPIALRAYRAREGGGEAPLV